MKSRWTFDTSVQQTGRNPTSQPGTLFHWAVAQTADDPRLAKALAPLSANVAMVSTKIDSDVIHAHTWYTLLAGHLAKMLYGIPLVVTVHSLEPKRTWKEEQLGRGYYLSSWMERTGIESADRIVAVSSGMRDDVIQIFNVNPDRVVVVHNGIDLERYRPRDDVGVRARYGISGRFVLFVGRISRQKGIDVLLKAVRLISKDVTLVLAATSPDTPELEGEVRYEVERNDRIVWINEMVDEDALVNLYSAADCLCLPVDLRAIRHHQPRSHGVAKRRLSPVPSAGYRKSWSTKRPGCSLRRPIRRVLPAPSTGSWETTPCARGSRMPAGTAPRSIFRGKPLLGRRLTSTARRRV